MFLQNLILTGNFLGLLFIPLVLIRKRQPVSALAWGLTVIFIPYLGILLFLFFGASSVKRRLRRKLFHRSQFLRLWSANHNQGSGMTIKTTWVKMDHYTLRVGGSPAVEGNHVRLYKEGKQAFEDKFEAIRAATHHIHLEYFILRNDEIGRSLIRLLCEKVSRGVEVRLLVDAIGSRNAIPLLEELIQAGGKAASFLPSRILSGRFAGGLRNHRKILVCDGKIGFVGGLNVGDEYLSQKSNLRHWRDTHMQIKGPAVLAIQRVFVEDWDFAFEELLTGDEYFPKPLMDGDACLQIVWSGPDQENNAARETYFVAITAAQKKLWIATPYLVPDGALLAALRTAALRGVDVRILTQSFPPDLWLPYWASRYFWEELMSCGVRIFEYDKGMMHSKVMLADGMWAAVGSANLDIRSIRLNFEIICHIHTQKIILELETCFEEDLKHSREVSLGTFRRRSWKCLLAENICRLFSPLL